MSQWRVPTLRSGSYAQIGRRGSLGGEPPTHRVSPEQAEGFRGDGRFILERRLGAGTFGVVFEAFDQVRNERVALKFLRHLNPTMVYRFKQEFRALSELIHPNLVSLHELIHHQGQWFFTMELIEGVSFLSYLFGDQFSEDATSTEGDLASGIPETPSELKAPPYEVERVRIAFRQLAEGISVLHAAGKLHRDIKPSNIMFTHDGRLVLLDFGLVTERSLSEQAPERYVVGTAPYMSPEQAAAQPLTGASDWYSLGVILFQTLTGRLPFEGPLREMLVQKQSKRAPRVLDLAPGAPEDLAALANDLLARNPRRRPSEEDILRRLSAQAPPRYLSKHAGAFVGRESQLAELSSAFASVQAGQPALVLLHGDSGMGKSAILRHFLEQLTEHEAAEVFRGRCYERESVPYKAVDSIVDALSRRLDPEEMASLEGVTPAHLTAIARLFPVLAHGPAEEPSEPLDPQEIRRQAFAGLRALLGGLARRRPLILALEDLQWGDLDSAALIDAVLRPPCPPLLFLGSYRSEEARRSPFLRALLSRRRVGIEPRSVKIGPLSQAESEALASSRLGREDDEARALAAQIARESAGNPYFVDELTGAYLTGERSDALTLEQALLARVARLPEESRTLLEVLAVAGRPIPIGVALLASGLPSTRRAELSQLCIGRLADAHGARKDDLIECFHDQVRAAVAGSLSADRVRTLHRYLADALIHSRGAEFEPESLVSHLVGAGDSERAAEYAERAARAAEDAFAFERATRLYRMAISFGRGDLLSLEERLAESLTHAGFSSEAGDVYLRLSKMPNARPEWKERAAREYIKSGRIDEGVVLLREVLAVAGLKLAGSPRRALLSSVLGRVALWLRGGLRYQERPESDISPELLRQLELCWMVSSTLDSADPTRGADFQTRHLRLALRSGSARHICRALGWEAVRLASSGVKNKDAAEKLISDARQMAERLNDPFLIGSILNDHGGVHMLTGEWRRALEKSDGAGRYLRERCGGLNFEALAAQVRGLWVLCYLGGFKELQLRVSQALSDAEVRGDRYAAISLQASQSSVLPLLAQDMVREAQEALQVAMSRWTPTGFHLQRYNDLLAQGEIYLYLGEGEACLARIDDNWRALKRSLIHFVQLGRIESYQLRARASLAVASQSKERAAALVKRAAEDAQRIEKEGAVWGSALAALLRGAIAWQRREPESAAQWLREAVRSCNAVGMSHYAAAAAHRLGEILPGTEGEEYRHIAAQYLSEQEILRADRFFAMLAPGF